ncbi:MAG: hypothetical protein RR993_03300 [Clostridia bacterium]
MRARLQICAYANMQVCKVAQMRICENEQLSVRPCKAQQCVWWGGEKNVPTKAPEKVREEKSNTFHKKLNLQKSSAKK